MRVASLSLTGIICLVLVYCFGSFLLQDMSSLLVFAFERQYKELTVNELLNFLN